jgi:hypothetical protein
MNFHRLSNTPMKISLPYRKIYFPVVNSTTKSLVLKSKEMFGCIKDRNNNKA